MLAISRRRFPARTAIAIMSTLVGSPHVTAQTIAAPVYKQGDIVISAPRVLQPPKGARVAAGYLVITNNGKTADRLVGGSAAFAQRFEIHEMAMDGGVMKMRELANGIEILPGAKVELKPGGNHLMYMGLTEAPVGGKLVKTKLRFENAGVIEIDMPVDAAGGAETSGHKH